MQQLGPGMIQQFQTQCQSCKGTGELIDHTLRCEECKGKKLIEVKELIEVNVERGMKDGEKVTFYELGEQVPGALPGDLLVVLKEENDTAFIRKGNDLFYSHKLTLSEALTGYEIAIQHMDGRYLVIKSNQIVKPGDTRVVEGEGMPIRRSDQKGRLYIKFDVVFPTEEQLSAGNRKKVEALLPAKQKLPKFGPNEIIDEVVANPYVPMVDDESDHQSQNQDDDDEGGQQGRTQCVHQ